MQPMFLSITIILGTLLLLGVVFAPRWGLRGRWMKMRRTQERQQIEDALKMIYHAQLDGLAPEMEDLTVSLGLSSSQVGRLTDRMRDQNLLAEGSRLRLTPEGQRWALQVIRAHRLWERYLADEARLPLQHIHAIANKREHGMTVGEIDALDAALGHPSSDPHGDPIPSAQGVLRSSPSLHKLASIPVGSLARITHLEDEPPVAYAQLLAEGLQVGQEINLLERSDKRVILSDGEREITLAPEIAENISLDLVEHPISPPEGVMPLSKLKSKQTAEIVALDERCQGFTRRRFLDLGLTPGTSITPELDNAFREPRAYRVRGTLIALRSDQAGMILVRSGTNGKQSTQA
jgi:DtxR family Mn-dependent transcriptional regulator